VKIKLQVKKATFVAVFLGNTLELLALYSRKQKNSFNIIAVFSNPMNKENDLKKRFEIC